ncbi:hypothetical protein NEOLI_005339 [Neolecta irregularis DAH-3]|uniref:Uncharacterized protein n=1 Tax=Neolecta irregularis (strain DAH-3) TaxID=1198029 RepID=A0A1U7LJE2_NEOID|nr:hypothetical protein NEOLI_005339 [Neolecta irregularis DAH-3]|eukprot:OLL22764.1 hypothetical protein NEOLI_005339 [Neolecta irregularis DAH-3]
MFFPALSPLSPLYGEYQTKKVATIEITLQLNQCSTLKNQIDYEKPHFVEVEVINEQILSMINIEIGKLKRSLRKDIQDVHIELLRQFAKQKFEMQRILEIGKIQLMELREANQTLKEQLSRM